MIHTYRINGLTVQTGDVICTMTGKANILLAGFGVWLGGLSLAMWTKVAMYLGPEGRYSESGAKGQEIWSGCIQRMAADSVISVQSSVISVRDQCSAGGVGYNYPSQSPITDYHISSLSLFSFEGISTASNVRLLKNRNLVNFTQFNLDSRLMAGIKKAGYETATPIQEAAIPAALRGRDLIGTAQTGTGKTAAFVLPILNRLLSGPRGVTRALIVTPTRELADQIHDVIRVLSAGTKLRSATLYGGVGAVPQIHALRNGAEILVACPGRLLDLIAQGHAKMNHIEVLVLDEGDRMFDMGFLPDVKRIIAAVPAHRQTMLFSATFPLEVEQLASSTLKHPQRIAMGISRPAYTVTHALYPVPQHLKSALLIELLKRTDTNSVLVFTRTRRRAEKVQRQIKAAGFNVTSLHSDRTQGQRQAALKGFKEGRHDIMVATDIAARGLDVESISHVINYDMPDTADAYIHRIGRTGRAQKTGDAFTLVTSEDEDLIKKLERIMGAPLRRETIEGFDYTAPAPPRPVNIRGRGISRLETRRERPAPTPKSYGKNRLGPRRKK